MAPWDGKDKTVNDKIELCFGENCPYKLMCRRYIDSLDSRDYDEHYVAFDMRPVTRKKFSHYERDKDVVIIHRFPYRFYKTTRKMKEVYVNEPINEPFICDGMIINSFVEDTINAQTP